MMLIQRDPCEVIPMTDELIFDFYLDEYFPLAFQLEKKLDLRGVRLPPGIVLRRRPSHTGRENPRTPAPPIHNDIEAHVRTTTTGAEP
jgi:hypothetical protein